MPLMTLKSVLDCICTEKILPDLPLKKQSIQHAKNKKHNKVKRYLPLEKIFHYYASVRDVAQLVERLVWDQEAASSSPAVPTIFTST